MFAALLNKRPLSGLCAIDLTSEGISIARLLANAGKPILESYIFHPCDEESVSEQLKLLAEQHQLNRCICSSLLNRHHYQLLVIETPPVPKEEIKSALRWRIKDLIDTPVTEITLDAFDVPAPRGASNSNSVYVVAAKSDVLNTHSANLISAKINLQIIDIMELAQRNIANLLPDSDNGVALLSLQSTSGLITLSKKGELYLSRPLNIGLEQATSADPSKTVTSEQQTEEQSNINPEIKNIAAYDHIMLELQRSLNYYEGNFRQAPIRKLYLAPTLKKLSGFPEYIKDNLNIDVELIDLNNLLISKTKIPQVIQAHIFFTIGAALHRIDDEPGN